MPETPKEKPAVDPHETEKEDSWEEDREKRGYYYDDAHGYEAYDPETAGRDDEDGAEDRPLVC